ncbi:hypothetical protein FOL47_010559 [Perkinsus chesapeaki]|uniref:Peptidase A1 domain-containing protein n=1 Tax=Perkinsus chesapeaki TaxID=330153 RepID=A0A7J6L2K2_PERCH|nr:hypothetical protein FOL47_010559 [Perkinsus chesapeaki]
MHTLPGAILSPKLPGDTPATGESSHPPLNLGDVHEVELIDHPSGWSEAKAWPIAAGASAYLTTKSQSSTLIPQKSQIEIIACLGGYDLISGPEAAIEELIARLDPNKKFISKVEVDNAKHGCSIKSKNVTDLPDVQFEANVAEGDSRTEEIILKAEDCTQYSTTQCNVARILFGALLVPQGSCIVASSNYWIMGKPYFRTYYTEFDYRNKKICFRARF